MITVRFAPSPTGHLHIGGLRTALFNYFFARNQGGQYILRIEDTDLERSSAEMAGEIIKGLQWLGLHWDQGPFFQSRRFHLYQQTARRLLSENKAYRCFCNIKEMELRRTDSETGEKLYKYDRHCLSLTQEEINEKIAANTPFVARFLIPPGKTFFKDALHKEMEIDNNELEDFVILKQDQSPTYHLSVVVDDDDMGVTHVIRGDDHLSNTFKQILLFKALDKNSPKFAHLPLILGADKKKLSKRHGETSVLEFKKNGYLPEAIINYLSQLSWIPADSKTIYPIEELSRLFKLDKLSKNSPVFDYEKLKFLNARAIQQKETRELLALLLEDPEFSSAIALLDETICLSLIDLIKPRMKTLNELKEKFLLYQLAQFNYLNPDFEKLTQMYANDQLTAYVRLLTIVLEKVDAFDKETVETTLRSCAEKNGLSAADLIHPARFAITSETVSPAIFDMIAFFGKEETLRRLNLFAAFLAQREV